MVSGILLLYPVCRTCSAGTAAGTAAAGPAACAAAAAGGLSGLFVSDHAAYHEEYSGEYHGDNYDVRDVNAVYEQIRSTYFVPDENRRAVALSEK